MSNKEPQKILVTIPFDPHDLKILEKIAEVDVRIGISPNGLENVIGKYHALIVGSNTIITGRAIEYAYQLQVIGVAGSSLDHINVSAARAQGVTVINVPNPRTLALAEQTISLILRQAHQHSLGGLTGKTLGIVGFGPTGHEVALRAKSFGMRVLVNQPRLTPELALEVGVEPYDLSDLLSEADFISLHLPTTAETKHLIGPVALDVCRREVVLINASHPEIVDTQALQAVLDKEKITGAAFLSYSDEEKALLEEISGLMVEEVYQSVLGGEGQDVAAELSNKIIEELHSYESGNPLSLLVVEVDNILPHEHFNQERVNDLAERLKTADRLVNPPVVARWQNHYVVLDGATRVNAFRQLEYPHIVVQVVSADDEHLLLHTWYHVLHGVAQNDLIDHLRGTDFYRLKQADNAIGGRFDKNPNLICNLRLVNGEVYRIETVEGVDRLVAMNKFVADYTEISMIERTLNTDINELSQTFEKMTALVIFPQFGIEDVLQAAVDGHLLPAGITRFVIPGRVLRVNADLKHLRSDNPLSHKNAWLNRLLTEKIAKRRVRYYQEPVFLLDE